MAAVKINTSLVERLVADQFPEWADLTVRPVEFDGWDNTTFRLGEDMAVRLPSAERYASQVAKEQRWLPELASFLPLPIPVPLAMGAPTGSYPWHWSVYQWLDGEPASADNIDDPNQFAIALSEFLTALQRVGATGGPSPGPHNFFRGGPLRTYDSETREALASLGGRIDTERAIAVWEEALRTEWQGTPVWFHGDISATNLLVRDGCLSAVIDFGCSGVGDPACDLTIAWTFLSGESRETFRGALSLGKATWARGRGWALWKALVTFAECVRSQRSEAGRARHVIDEVLDDHNRAV